MSTADNATATVAVTQPLRGQRGLSLSSGMLLGSVAVLGFSFSLPATRLALRDIDPWLVAFGRALVAAVLSVIVLRAARAPWPTRAQWRSLAIVAAGVVVGF